MLNRIITAWSGLFILALLSQCQWPQHGPDTLFQLLPASQTGVDFQNTVTPNEELNILNFEYMYNGGGVGVGDFDNDGLPDLVFTGNMVPSRIYRNQGNLQFEDITEATGFDTGGHWCTGVSVIDINQDGLDDIYVGVGGPGMKSVYPNLLFINQGDGSFRESAAAYGLDDPNETTQAIFFDYDRDGDLDMYLLNGGGFERSAITVKPILKDGSGRNTDKLYQNNYNDTLGHPVFTDVSAEAGITIEGFGLGVGIIDANQDDWPDIYVSNDYLSTDLLYLNQQDGTFTEASARYFNHTSHFSMGNDIGDINNDGTFDIVTLDMLPESHVRRKTMFGPHQYDKFQQAVSYGYGYQYMRNMLHMGVDSQGFSEIGQLAGIDRTDWSWCPLIADFDNDGLQDLHITNGYGKDVTDLDFVKFRKGAVTMFASPDERRQHVLESMAEQPAIVLPNYIYRNKGDNTFENEIEAWGLEYPSISTGAAYVDLDQDGDLEIITNNLDQPAFIFRNNLREHDSTAGHYLQVRLEGPAGNQKGIGASLRLYAGEQQQLRSLQPVRGFQSTVSDELHFGLGASELIDSLVVQWPDGKRTVRYDIPADQRLVLSYLEAGVASPPQPEQARLLQAIELLRHSQQEPAYAGDFKNQPLLLHGFANQGPGMAVGDVNNDQLDDVFIGGAYGEAATLYLQTANGGFMPRPLATEQYEDLGAIFLDIDGDQDLDLYVASGGSERYDGNEFYQDRVYTNDGTGQFTLDQAALPPLLTSTTAVSAADFDRDGDLDLFVGGRVVPGRFPEAPPSYLLENEGGRFTDATERVCAELGAIGMVTSALWTDFNNDQRPDLIVVGEMMAISVFQNEGATLRNVTEAAGLAEATGMWNSIASGDFDQDGDTDYAVGNVGRNTYFRSSPAHPLRLHYADFDQNGAVDPIYSIFEEDDYYPLAALDLLTTQLPVLKKQILHYHTYARSNTDEVLGILNAPDMQTLICEHQSSILLENTGDGQFTMHELPLMVQVAPVKGILIEDLNLDGRPDLLLVGNEYNTEVVSGKLDASPGFTLINEGDFQFRLLPAGQSGLRNTGDTRAVVDVALADGSQLLLVSKNNGPLESYLLQAADPARRLAFRQDELSASVEYEDGRREKLEYHLGAGYLSQCSRAIRLSTQATRIVFYDHLGATTRTIDLVENTDNS
ncbi:MAG: VCBS repeat-containing protein [Lewinella sp.]|nr:VCBS repeat-containing protein [Lewinella sp.]